MTDLEKQLLERVRMARGGRITAIDVCRGLNWGRAFWTLEALVSRGVLKRIKRTGNDNPLYGLA